MPKKKGSNTGIPGVSFSWKRASGVTKMKSQIAKATGIPTTKAGRQRKLGKAVGTGCTSIILVMIVFILAAAFCFSANTKNQEPDSKAAKAAAQGKADQEQASNRSQADAQRKKLIELNRAIQELDQKALEINNQKKSLESEREQVIASLADDNSQRQHESLNEYLVVDIDGNCDLRLLVDGKPRDFHLYGVYLTRPAEAHRYLKGKLVLGTAYIRCTDRDCYWGYLYDVKNGTSLNAQLVKNGYATTVDSTALDESKHTYIRGESPSENPPSVPPASSSDGSDSAGISTRPTSGTEVQVKGYTRKDGTYVQPHTRSAPHRKP